MPRADDVAPDRIGQLKIADFDHVRWSAERNRTNEMIFSEAEAKILVHIDINLAAAVGVVAKGIGFFGFVPIHVRLVIRTTEDV